MRLFVAVNLAEGVRGRMAQVQKPLVATGADVKWVEAGNLHITLKFLGEVEPGKVDAIAGECRQVAEAGQAFAAEFGGMGAFPNVRAPRVVWVGLTRGVEELGALARDLEGRLAGLGFEREGRPFSGHITLGRVRSFKGREALAREMERGKDCEIGEMSVEKFALMESVLGRAGAEYSVVQEFALGAS